MNLHEYQIATRATAVYPGAGTPLGLAYCTIGLIGEVGEYMEKRYADEYVEADEVAEVGDCTWYAAGVAHEMGDDLQDIFDVHTPFPISSDFEGLAMATALLSNPVKKLIRGDVKRDANHLVARRYLSTVTHIIDDIVKKRYHVSMRDILHRNIDKLTARAAAGTLKGSGDHR